MQVPGNGLGIGIRRDFTKRRYRALLSHEFAADGHGFRHAVRRQAKDIATFQTAHFGRIAKFLNNAERRAADGFERAGCMARAQQNGASCPALQNCNSPLARSRIPANMVMNSILRIVARYFRVGPVDDRGDVAFAAKRATLAHRFSECHEQRGPERLFR